MKLTYLLIILGCLASVSAGLITLTQTRLEGNKQACLNNYNDGYATDACQVILYGHKGGY